MQYVIILLLILHSCKCNNQNLSLPKHNDTVIIQNKDTTTTSRTDNVKVLVDTLFFKNKNKDMFICFYRNNYGGNQGDFKYNIIIKKDNKIISEKWYYYLMETGYASSTTNLYKINDNFFYGINSPPSTPSYEEHYFRINWDKLEIKIEKHVSFSVDSNGLEHTYTTPINKTIDEYEAELKAEFSK
jgi:hypothetical protein